MEQTIGKYRIQREIGKGGMGIIYKALDPASQKSVAIKVLPPTMVDRSTVERFNREIHVLTALKHPNVIEVVESGTQGGSHYIVMEQVEGQDLKTVIQRKGRLSVKEALDISAQVADALAYTHKEGMIHRDIKPSNIMVTGDGRVKVLDFGLVKILGKTNVTMSGTSLGTVDYMSPEQITNEGVDSRTDIYSLGVTMYEMLSGKTPFSGDTIESVMMKHQRETPVELRTLNPEVPVELEMIVSKAMSKDMIHRYQKVQDVLNDINKLRGAQSRRLSDSTVIKKQESRVTRSISGKSQEPLAQYPIKQKNHFMRNAFIVVMIAAGAVLFLRNKLPKLLPQSEQIGKMIPVGKKNLLKETQDSLKKLEEAENHYQAGMGLLNAGSTDKAISEFQKAISLRRDYPAYYKDLALAYEKKNQKNKAVQAWMDLLKYDTSGHFSKLANERLEQLSSK